MSVVATVTETERKAELVEAVLGYCTKSTLESGFVSSLVGALTSDTGRERFGQRVVQVEGPPMLADLRSEVVRRFLVYPQDWLFMVDTDMTFTPRDVDALFTCADPESRPIVSGIARTIHDRLSCCWLDEGSWVWPARMEELETRAVDGLCQVDAVGTAFLLVHRSVFERFTRWFDYIDAGAELLTEDASFCLRARAAGIPIFVNTAVRVGHIKPQVLRP